MNTTSFLHRPALLLLALLGLGLALPASGSSATVCPQTNCCVQVWTTFLAVNGTSSGNGVTGTVHGQNSWWSTVSTTDNDSHLGTCADSGCVDFSFNIGAGDVGYYKIRCQVWAQNPHTEAIVGIVGQNDTCEGYTTTWKCPAPQVSSGFSMATWYTQSHASYRWDYVTNENCESPFTTAPAPSNANARVWYLTAGSYDLRIMAKESNEYFYRVELMTDPIFTPTPSPTFTRSPTPTATRTAVGGGITQTPTPSITPTWTWTPMPKEYAGLPTNMRLYGLEYIPFPTVVIPGGAPTTFNGLDVTFTTSGGQVVPINTARWHITFQNLSFSVGVHPAVSLAPFGVETRIGPYGVTCTSGVYDPTVYQSLTTLPLPQRPQNFSSAYFYMSESNTTVPVTERFDAVGDPRFMPYADVVDYSGDTDGTFQGNYNWFFRNMNDGTGSNNDSLQWQYYNPFLNSANWDHYSGNQQNIDIPKLLGLIREGVMISNSVYTAMSGWDTYYAGQGGELGGDTSNLLNHGVPIYGGPWGSSSTTYYADEILGQSEYSQVQTDGASYVVAGSSGTPSWWSLPFVGELWPDSQYVSNWEGWNPANTGNNLTWGNLNNNQMGGTSWRVPMQNVGNSLFSFNRSYHRNSAEGCASLLNGTQDGSHTFDHYSTDFDADLLPDGLTMSSEYNFTLPSTFEVTRPWGLTIGDNNPDEWTYQPYAGRRTHLDVYSADPTSRVSNLSWGFYSDDDGGRTDANLTYKASAAVRAIDINNVMPVTNTAHAYGWFVINGLANSTASGINFVAQFAILGCLRTFTDAGVPTAAAGSVFGSFTNTNNIYNTVTYRIPPVPLVSFIYPVNNDTTVHGKSSLNLQWEERYVRWDGNQYTENYPCPDDNVGNCTSADPDPNPATEWHDTTPGVSLAFNVIYNAPNGVSPTAWYSVLDGALVTRGQYSDAESIAWKSSYIYTQSWSGIPAGIYNLEVECFRLPEGGSGTAYPHYAYHEVQINTSLVAP